MPTETRKEPAGAPPPPPPPPATLPFANDGSFMEQFLKMQQHQELETASTSNAAGGDSDFLPSASFIGTKEGFVFKSGTHGLGYYKDSPPQPATKPGNSAVQKPAKPVILKSKPIIAVQKRSGSAGELSTSTKKKKTDQEEDKSFYQKEMERYRSKTCGSDTSHERPLVK